MMPLHLVNKLPVGAKYMLLSAFAFALMSSCVKLVSTYGIPVFEIIAARAIVSLVISYTDVKRKRISLWGNNKKLLISRGLSGTLALLCIYYALATLPLAEATLLQYLYPVFTSILAIIFLHEKIQRSTILCICCCLLGLLLIVETGSNQALPMFSVGIAIVGAFGSAVSYTLVKRLSNSEDSSVIIFYFPLIALPISALLLGNDFVLPNTQALLLLLFVGVFTQIGQIGLTNAMKTEDASKATAYSYVQVIFSITIGWLFFNESPSLSTLSGGLFIVAGALINVFYKSKKT